MLRKRKEQTERSRFGDRLMEFFVYLSGGTLITIILAIFFYLTYESRHAFERKFTYGYVFALQPEQGEYEKEIMYDPFGTTLTAHIEGDDALDSKEEISPLMGLSDLKGVQSLVTFARLGGKSSEATSETLFKDDWREAKKANQPHDFLFYAFATPEYSYRKMYLAWDVSQDADPELAPFDIRLKSVQVPEGASPLAINIDLKEQPQGRIELPTFVATSDPSRTEGYAFQVVASPRNTGVLATIANFFKTEWGPTLAHQRFGFIPLLLSTLFVTFLAVVFAAPIALASAVYLAELAPAKLREILKPVIEMLASIPTIVLGYFGLMLVAPGVQEYIAERLGIESGRGLLTTALMMGVLLIPTIMTIAEDGLRSVPNSLRDGGDALGLTKLEGLKKIVLPAARSSMVAAVMLGIARALGETMIVWVLSGGTPTMPAFGSIKETAANLVQTTRGMPDTIGIEMGNVTFGDPHYGHLFMLGFVLFVMTLIMNLWAFKFARRHVWRH